MKIQVGFSCPTTINNRAQIMGEYKLLCVRPFSGLADIVKFRYPLSVPRRGGTGVPLIFPPALYT
jgi:hypothetical protein